MNGGRRFRTTVFLAFALFISANSAIVRAQSDDDDRKDAITLFNQAQDAQEKGELMEAIALYGRALEIMPEFAEAQYQRGTAYLSLGRTSEAEVSFRAANKLRPDWTLAMTGLGSLLMKEGKYGEADELLSRSVESDPGNFPGFAALAELRLRTNAPAASLRDLLTKLTAATEKANPTASIWSARAALENAVGDRKSAKKSLAEALTIDPMNAFALTETVNIAIVEGDVLSASEAVGKLERIDPASDQTKLLRARVLAAEGRTADASKLLETLNGTVPGAKELNDALALLQTKDPSKLEEALANDPKNPAILGRLCSLFRVSDPPKALDFCRRANQADPSNIDHAIGYGAALVQAHQFEQAVALFTRLIEAAPDNSTAHANLAAALFELQRYAEAKVQYQWLIARQPDLAAAYYLLGITHDHLAEYLDAMANYQQFLRIADPAKNQLEIDKVNLRLPALEKQIKNQKGKRGN